MEIGGSEGGIENLQIIVLSMAKSICQSTAQWNCHHRWQWSGWDEIEHGSAVAGGCGIQLAATGYTITVTNWKKWNTGQ